jgi:hypothetical protein
MSSDSNPQKYKKCFCVEETANPDTDDIHVVNSHTETPINENNESEDDIEKDLKQRLANLKGNHNGGYKRYKTKGEHLVHSYKKSKKGGKTIKTRGKTIKKRSKTIKKRSKTNNKRSKTNNKRSKTNNKRKNKTHKI